MNLENTNKAIAINTIILYVRLGITLVCGLLTTRFALQALGVVDFGLISVVASIIIFINIVNTTMLGSSNRFIAAAIGRGDVDDINKTFNVNLVIHLFIAILTLLVALPIGYWYIHHFVNYDGPISNAWMVFLISIIGSVISFIGVPYHGVMLARERFLAFSLTDVFFTLFKLMMTYLLLFHFSNKLLVYALVIGFNTACPAIIFYLYCKKCFPETVKIRIVKERNKYKEVLVFSVWVGYGAFVQVGQTQCAALLINAFFNTIMNTALSVANHLKSAVSLFTANLTKPIAPQITKCYAAGNFERCITLMVFISKISFLSTFFIATPFLIETRYIINLWLGSVPEYSVLFSRLIVLDIVVGSFNAGIAEYIFAGGRIKTYQLLVNTFLFLSIVVGYIVLRLGYPAYTLMIVYVIFSFLALILRQIILHKEYKFDNMILIKKAYLPSIAVVTLSLPLFFIQFGLHPVLRIFLIMLYEVLVMFFVGLNSNERSKLILAIKNKIKHV